MSQKTLEGTAEGKTKTIWNALFLNIFIINFCQSMGQQMMNTLIPKYADSLGASASVVGMVSSMFAVTALAIRPIAGPAFDCFQKKKLLLAALIVMDAAYFIYSISTSIPVIVAARLIHGCGIGCVAPLCLAMASDALPDHLLSSGIGMFSLGQAVSQAIGPSVGLSLSRSIGYNNTFRIGAAVISLACVLAFFMKTPEFHRTSKYEIKLRKIVVKEAVLPAVLMFFLSMSYSCVNSFIAIYGGLRGVENIGLYFTVYAVCLLVTRPFSGRIADKYGIDKVLIPGIIGFAFSFFLVSRAENLAGFLVSAVFSSCGYGICQPMIQSLCMKCVPKERRGAAGNTNYIGTDLGMLLGPTIGGMVIEGVSAAGPAVSAYSSMYCVMILPMAAAFVFFLFNRKRLLQKSGRGKGSLSR